MSERFVKKLGKHYILVMMIMTRLFGAVGGLAVIYYVELTQRLPHPVRLHFWVICAIVVTIAIALSMLLAMGETRNLRPVLHQLRAGKRPDPYQAAAAGREAVRFPSRHHWHEAWFVPCTTYVPCIIALKVLDDIQGDVVENITAACFMSISMAVMSHYFATERCMQPVIRYLLNHGAPIDFRSLPLGRLQLRLNLCFALMITTTALMVGTQARQRTADIIRQPENQAEAVASLRAHSSYITIAAVLTGLMLSSVLARSVASRVAGLLQAMERVQRGHLSERVQATGNDEIDVLARQFNTMVEKLQCDDQTIRDLNQNLEQKVADRTQQLESTVDELRVTQRQMTEYNKQLELARAEAEAANRAKGQFVANISHELRTPLNGVIGLTELLLDTPLDGQQRKYARRAKYSGETLLTLINEILDFSKIEAGMVELERIEFDLLRTVESVIEVIAHRCTEKRLELICYLDPRLPTRLYGDPARLRQVLTNLANNAAKFTEAGEVVIEAMLEQETETQLDVRFEVRDTGIGMAPDRLRHAFEPFTQADASTTRRYGGSGLGLTISQQLCKLMGGRIDANSVEGEGSSFWLTLRFGKVADAGQQRLTAPTWLEGSRVLVVDDNTTSRQVLTKLLTKWGCAAEMAADAESALDKLDRAAAAGASFRLVLSDLEMRDTDGEQLARDIRSRGGATETLLMVPLGRHLEASRLQDAGVNGFVVKPILPSELLETIARAAAGKMQHASGSPPDARLLEAADKEPPFPRTRHQGARLLLAEDNDVSQYVALQMLKKAGYECDVVADGLEALEAVRSSRYDAVVMDCHMPRMDGLEATRTIRCDEEQGRVSAGRALPIIALTANAMKSDRERCRKAGMTDYLSKPLDPAALVETIDACLAHLDDSPAAPSRVENKARPADATPDDEELCSQILETVLDLDSFLRRCMDDKEVANRVLSKFWSRAPGELDQIETLIRAGDHEALVHAAHALKGAAANLSAEGIRSTAARLETAAREAALDRARDCLTDLRGEWKRFVQGLPTVFAGSGLVAPTSSSPIQES